MIEISGVRVQFSCPRLGQRFGAHRKVDSDPTYSPRRRVGVDVKQYSLSQAGSAVKRRSRNRRSGSCWVRLKARS